VRLPELKPSHTAPEIGSLVRSGLQTRIGGDGKRFVVHADEKLTAFMEPERAIHEFAVDLIS
jgi:hypothetical protein